MTPEMLRDDPKIQSINRQGKDEKFLNMDFQVGLLINSKEKVITSKFHFTACSSKKTVLLVRK